MKYLVTLIVAVLMFVAGRSSVDTVEVPTTSTTTVVVTTTSTTEPPTTTTTLVEETTTTTEPPPTTTTPTTTRVTTTTLGEPVLCPGLPHPAHHRPCPVDTPPTTEKPAPPASGGCANAMIGIRAVGLPAGFDVYCSAAKAEGHAGIAVWYFDGFNHSGYVAINPSTGDYPGVGAHEACHAWDFVTKGSSSEAGADACAAAHGYPNPYAG